MQKPEETDYETGQERVRKNVSQQDRAAASVSRQLPELDAAFAEKLFYFLAISVWPVDSES